MNSKIIVAGNISDKSVETLKKFNIDILKTYKCDNTYNQISYHTDIQMFSYKNNLVISEDMYDKYVEKFEKEVNLNILKGSTSIKDKYPKNIMYNGCIVGNIFVHNLKYTDKKILELLEKNEIKFINVKQGYTKCNISIVDNNSVITSDRGIEKALSKYIDVLYIEQDNILLDNMQGFIGGSTGIIDDYWCINGDINRLKQCDKILDFLKLKNRKVLCLNDEDVIDIGSIIQIKN